MSRIEFERTLADTKRLFDYHRIDDALSAADAIICLGSYDLRVADRTAELFSQGFADLVVVTGALGNWTKGTFDRPEAEIFADRLLSLGVPHGAILLEPKATNIGENIRFSRLKLGERRIDKLILVTKPQTQRRVQATAMKVWPEVRHIVTAPQCDLYQQASAAGGMSALIAEMVGDIERLLDYPHRGYQVVVELADEVLAAQRRLKSAGFDSHCLRL